MFFTREATPTRWPQPSYRLFRKHAAVALRAPWRTRGWISAGPGGMSPASSPRFVGGILLRSRCRVGSSCREFQVIQSHRWRHSSSNPGLGFQSSAFTASLINPEWNA